MSHEPHRTTPAQNPAARASDPGPATDAHAGTTPLSPAVDLASLAQAIAQSDEAVVITGPDGRIGYVNTAFERITGYTATEVLGRTTNLLKSGRHDEAFYRELWDTLRAGRTWRGHLHNRRKDGSLYEEECSISPVYGAGGDLIHYVAVKRDVTREVLMEQQLRQSEKMEAVARLAGSLAHDFNNLLTAINGFATMAREELQPGHQAVDDIDQILHAARRAGNLTQRLLSFSRRRPAQQRPISLNDVLMDTAPLLRSLLGAGVELVLLPGDDLASVNADPAQFSDILLHLAANAKDAMPAGGKLTLATGNRVLAPEPGQAADALQGPCVLLSVRDSGCGMTPEVRAHLFEPFFTTKGETVGTGLGLATVYSLTRQAGGCIRVESTPGQGTVFDLYFPRFQGAAEPAATPPAPPTTEPAAAPLILLAEDEPALRQLIGRMLRGHGFQVEEAGNGEEALRAFHRRQGAVALLLSDVIMPIMGGLELAVELRLRRPALPIVFISGYTDELFVGAPELRAGTFFLQKPFTQRALVDLLRRALGTAERRAA